MAVALFCLSPFGQKKKKVIPEILLRDKFSAATLQKTKIVFVKNQQKTAHVSPSRSKSQAASSINKP